MLNRNKFILLLLAVFFLSPALILSLFYNPLKDWYFDGMYQEQGEALSELFNKENLLNRAS